MDGDGPFERFCDEIDEVVRRWADKPLDDGLTYAQVVGALQFTAFKLMHDAWQRRADVVEDGD